RDGGKRAGIDLVEVLDRLGRVPLGTVPAMVALSRPEGDAMAAHGQVSRESRLAGGGLTENYL
ncbi:MAG TPA: hypothetical protein VFQ71_03215, partial [Gaiellales bacterium]|nr:hypothetical protein [Gaiellales bacterium]